MKNVGIVGWRGMVGSVLMQRMVEENDFKGFKGHFFSTSQAGEKAPSYQSDEAVLLDALDIKELEKMDIVLTCQGGSYTEKVHTKLRESGWNGYWIDAASTLRMKDDSVIVLDPVNRNVIDQALESGTKDFIGGNCTVSLMMLAIGGLLDKGLVEWVSTMTYQAASGGGARHMRELISQMEVTGVTASKLNNDPSTNIIEIDKLVTETINSENFPTTLFGAPLSGSLIPWIDSEVEDGQTREEWKGMSETNKILALSEDTQIPVDGTCVRIAAMRSHSQGLTIKLTKNISIEEIEKILEESNEWVEVVKNDKESTLNKLTPAYTTGTLKVPVGRIRKMKMGEEYLNIFTVGDQLLWGAAEPVRRMLNIALNFSNI